MSKRVYTYEEVKEIAGRYDSLAEFTNNHFCAYEAALRNGWLESFTHLKRNRVHTVESILDECKKFNSYKEFISSDKSIYNTFLNFYNNNKINDEDLPWKVTKRTNVWDYNACYNEAMKYDSRFHFKNGSRAAYNKAMKEKWLDDYTWFVKSESKYTYDVCKELASKYNSRVEFQKAESGAYSQAARKGWIDLLFPKEQKQIKSS